MRGLCRTTLAVTFVVILSSCGGDQYDSHRLQQQITVDGNSLDWNNIPLEFLEDQPMVIGFANDDSVLYATFRFTDAALARKIHFRGVIVWLNSDNSETKSFGLRYHRFFAGSPPEHRTGGEIESQPITLDGKFMVVQGDMKLSTDMEYFPGVGAAAGQDKNLYVFEFAVPFKYLAADHQPFSRDKIGLGIEIGALTGDERSAMRKEMGERGNDQSPRGMRSGGGRPGMWEGRGSRLDRESEEIWMTVNLAK